MHVDEGAQAVILAEIAAGILIARSAIADALDRVEPNKCSLVSILVEAHCLHASSNRAGFAAVLVDDDLGFRLIAAEVRFHEVDFSFHRREILLRAALQDEALAELCQIGNAGNVQKDVLRQHRCEAGEDLLGRPSLPLEVDDVRLHEDSAAVAEDRHLVGGECNIRVLVYLDA